MNRSKRRRIVFLGKLAMLHTFEPASFNFDMKHGEAVPTDSKGGLEECI